MITGNAPGPRFRRHWPAFAMCLMLAFAWSPSPAGAQPEDTQKGTGPCVNVDITRVQRADLEETVRGIGTLEAAQKVVVYPEVGGIIESVNFKEGQRVEKNTLLFRLDDAKIRAQLKAREAALEEARANLENARLIYNRRERLFKQKLGTEEARDEARTRYQAAAAQVKRIEAEIENIRETLKDTQIRAPFDGITGEQMVDPGQLVDTDTPLSSIVAIRRMKIAFTVPERYLGRVETGQEIRLRVAAFPQKTFSGRVYFVSPQIDPVTRTLQVKAELANPENMLRPGGFAAVDLIVGIRKNVPVIPEEALVPTRSGYMVFTVQDWRARGREVEIGLRRPGIVEITGGLEEGETIVRAGHISLHEGARVCPKQGQ